MIANIEEVKKKLRPYLRQYLEEQGVKFPGGGNMCLCINPAHNDHQPSMSLGGTEDQSLFRCQGCSAAGDIFTAAHYLEGKPLSGMDFVVENLQYLADRYKIPYETRDLTEEEREAFEIKHLYSIINDIIVANSVRLRSKMPEHVSQYIHEKQLDELLTMHSGLLDTGVEEINPFRRYEIGWVENYDDFISQLESMGFQKDFLVKKADIKRSVFSPDNLIFTLRDRHNSIIAFAARNCLYEKDTGAKKYMNTSAVNGIYKKKFALYNLQNAINRSKGSGLVYLVEGYTDAIALDKNGLPAVAIMGTTIHPEHIQTLAAHGLMNIVIVLDGDSAGKDGVSRSIVKVFSGIRNVSVKVIELPEGDDPASFIFRHDINEFLNLDVEPLFRWYLDHLITDQGRDPGIVANEVIPLIVNESSYIERERMIQALSEVTGISEHSIAAEVDRLDNIRMRSQEAEIANVIDLTVKQLTRNPGEAYTILTGAVSDIETIQKKYEQDRMSIDEFIHRVQALSEMQKSSAVMGYNLPGMGMLGDTLAGNWKGKSFFIGGEPNAGKTNFMVNLAMSLIQGNKDKISILYHTTDDSAEDITTRFITYIIYNLFDYHHATINNVEAPGYFAENEDPNFLLLYDKAVNFLIGLAQKGLLVIKDSQQGDTFAFGKRWITEHKRQFPGRDIIYIADNFHNFNDFSESYGGSEGRWRIKRMANFLKNDIAVKLGITTIATVEYRKEGSRKDKVMDRQSYNERVAEAKTIEYVSNLMIHLLNPLQTGRDSSMFFPYKGEKYPIIELIIGKNKVTSNKQTLYYKHFQESVVFSPVMPDELDMYRRSNEQSEY